MSVSSDPEVLPTLNERYAQILSRVQLTLKPKIYKRPHATASIVVAITPRSGSSMFCSLLEGTESLGFPDEYLNDGGPMQMHARKVSRNRFDEYWDALLRKRQTANGVFGLKADYRQLLPLIERNLVDELVPSARYVLLTRSDLVAQAVSLHRAATSGLWHKDREGQPWGSPQHSEPAYDRDAIQGHIAHLIHSEDCWNDFFRQRRIAALRLTYERVAADPAAAVERCLTHLGVVSAVDIASLTPVTSKLGDELNDEWCRRFISETGFSATDLRANGSYPNANRMIDGETP